MHYIKQFFTGKIEDWVHQRFIKFGRGEFNGPAITVKKTKNGVKVSGSWDYAGALLEAAGSGGDSITVQGMVFARRDVSSEVKDFFTVSKEKKKKGRYSCEVTGEIEAEALKGLTAMIPDAVFLANAKSGKNRVRSKKKPPKPGSKLNESFCSASLDKEGMNRLLEELLFDISGDFNEVTVNHKYVIDEIVPPEGVSDPARIRVEAKRKGVIKRSVSVDGKSKESEADLFV